MKNRIYSKLFKFADIKSWEKENSNYVSIYYNNTYKLEYHSEGIMWSYRIYRSKNYGYDTDSTHEGIVTLNTAGKIFFTVILSILLWLMLLLLPSGFKHAVDLRVCVDIIIGLFILSCFILSIFNWSIYRTLMKVQYYIRNKKLITEKEKDELLMKEVVNVINKKIANNPKLARKTKLQQLNKKRWFNKKNFDTNEYPADHSGHDGLPNQCK